MAVALLEPVTGWQALAAAEQLRSELDGPEDSVCVLQVSEWPVCSCET